MGKHAAETSEPKKNSPWRIGLLTFLISSVVVTLVGMVMLWPDSDDVVLADNFSQTFAGNHEQVDGTITLVDNSACNSPDTGRVFAESPTISAEPATLECVRALVDITSGANEGHPLLKTRIDTHSLMG